MLIRDTLLADAKAVSVLVDAVARERRYLAGTSGFSEESTASFIELLRSVQGIHVVGIVDDMIVGWCDITPCCHEGMTHVGRLGMGVKAGFRGQGIGTALLRAALERAFGLGAEQPVGDRRVGAHGLQGEREVGRELERVELEVFRSNTSAIRLYEAHGFVREGVKVGARKLDGMVDDIVLFATFRETHGRGGW